jgi:hypothetical protein
MTDPWRSHAVDGEPVAPDDIAPAVLAAPLRYADGAHQIFRPDGSTTYTEHGAETHGEWSVEAGRFCSFWPPTYRACYDLRWIVAHGELTGLRFDDGRAQFDGHYES